MPKQKAPRPTKTNIGDYLLDFDGTDFSQFGGQQAQQQEEEPGFLSKVGSSAQAIAEGATMLPGQIADTLRDAYHGGDVNVTDTDAIRARQAREQERADYGKKYDGKAFEGVTDAMNSMGYSMGTMGASLGAAALASPAGPVAAGAAGMAASGAMAYRATKQQFLQQMLGETEKVLGRLPTQDEWDKIATEFDGEATRYGAWEAGPEALSNLFMAKILGPLGKGLLRGSVGQGIKRIGGLYGEELATETATQMGQGQEEANVGLRDTAPGVWDAFKEIGPATFWQTTLMAGGKKGADMLANRMRARSQQVENNVDQTQQQGQGTTGLTNQAALPMAQGIFALPQGDGSIPMGSTDTGRGPIAAGVVSGQHPKPFLSDADHADTEAFVRAFEERERNRDDEEALIEYGQRQARSPAQLALDQGENVDLLSLPQGNAAMAMGTEETGRAPIAPPTDYAGQPIATPYTPRPALPEQTSQSAGIGRWAGGRSQLAYGPKSEPQMMQGLGIMPQQGAPVQPQAMPTSSQIGNIQAAPRADTMAAASALGVPAPQAVPQEAQHPQALQHTQAMPNMADRMPEGGGLHTEPPTQPAAKDPLLTPVVQERHKLLAMLPEAERKKARSMPLSLLRKKVDQVGMEAEAPDTVEKKAAPKRVSRIDLIRQLPREEQGQYRDKPNAVILKRIQQLSEVAAEPTAPMAENVNAQLEENSGQIAPSDSAELPTAEQPEAVSVGTPAVDPIAEPAPQPKSEPVQKQDKAPAKGPENVAENDATEKTAPAEAIKGNEKDKAQPEPETKDDAHDAKEKEERKPEKGHAKEARSQASDAQAFIDRYLDGGEGTIEDLEKAFREVKAADPEAFSKLKGRISPYDRAERNLFEKVAAAKNDKQEVLEAADKKEATDAKGTEDAKRKDPAAKEPVPDKSADDKPSPDSASGEQETASPKQSKGTEGTTPKGIALKLGEHIGGSRADTASSSGKSPRRHGTKTQEDKTPAWRKRYDIVKAVNSDEWRLFDNRTKRAVPIWDRWNSEEEAEAALPLAVAKLNHYISKSDNRQQFAIKRKVSDRKRVIIKDGFKTLEEAGAYFEKNAAEILEAKTSLGEEILPAPKDVFREGPERRKGDVKPDDFLTDFGFRGAEFGKWNNQEERQDLLNHAYDGLMDLSDIIGVPPRALSLNGELGIAFGARGQGLSGARAHYEPGYAVINLTKMHGAGSLAHEWMHAMDNYFARQDGKTSSERKENARGDKVYAVGDKKMDYASHGFLRKDSGVRPEVQEAYSALVKAMYTKAEQYVEDTQKAERFVSGARDQLQKHIDGIRKGLDKKLEYRTRNAAPATSEQLAAFDGIVQRLVDGEDLNTSLRESDGGLPRRKSNDLMDELAKLYKKVRGKSGFTDIYRGPIGDIGGLLARYKQRVEILESAKKENVQTKSVPTSYRMDARRLDEGRATDYWGTEHEMLSRAFSAYVEDKAEERGIRTDFLSYGSNNELPQFKLLGVRPYPEGKERTALNRAFDNLFTTLEAKETDKGVALASLKKETEKAEQEKSPLKEGAQTDHSDKGTPRASDGNLATDGSGKSGLSAGKDTEAKKEVNKRQDGLAPGQFLPKIEGKRAGMRLEDVQTVADKIGKLAKNAAASRVVQGFDELPYSIRERYSDAKNSVEGVFDPRSGVVWMVADNLSDPTRAAEVWAHEQIVHHGLRGLLPADARRRVLNQLWLGAGGMKNAMVKDIASRYGLAPTRSLQDRQTVMEEVIAALAEKKGQGLLERADGNLWRKVVSALHRAWNSLVRAVSGREGTMNLDNIDALLSALGRHVIDGESSGITQKAGPFEQAAAPASRSNKTAEDPQHMASLAEDTAQLSEHLKRVFSSEGLAAGIRQTRKVLGRGVSDDVAEILSNPEMGKLFEEKDLSLFERLFKLPHWISKDHTKFATVYNRQLERNDERNSATQKSVSEVPLLFDSDKKKRLNDKEIDELGKMIWQWDGKEIPELSWKKIEKFKEVDETESGRPILEMNPDFYPAFEKWLEKQPQTKRVKDAFLQVRKSLDNDFLKAYAKMAAMSDLADTDLEMYRTGFGMLPNYFPHQRKGKYYVVATAGKGVVGDPKTVVYRKHFDVPVGSSVREEWAKIVAANKKEFPGAKWENPRESTALPDDILGAPIDMSAMEQLVKTAAGKLPSNEQAEEVKKILLTGLSDILKARGFGSHGIERQNIPGFDKDDVIGTLYSYKSGLNGWLTKMEAASDFAAALGKIDAKKNPRLWEYASQYIKDVLRNSDKIDRMAGNIKTVAFAWYLGANIKTVSVNVTQNLIIGVPRLEQYVTGGAGLWLKSAMDSIGLRYTTAGVSGTNKLTKDEQRLIQELYGDGVVTDAYMEELRGRLTKNPAEKTWNTFIKLMGYPMSVVERFNRASLALAAYRAATKGKLREKAAKELGLKPGEEMNYEQAKEFATMLVRDSHYEYGKSNAPEVFRSSVAGRMASPAYVFRSFGANTLNLYARALLKEGVEGRVFLAKSLGATIALGGLTAFPFYATLSALFGVGDDEDWTTKIRKALPKNDLLRDIVCYGVPSMAGFSIGGSLRMETPFTDGLRKGGSYQEVITQSLGGLIGIPYDMAVNRVGKAMEAAKYGETSRMIEALVPTAVSNAMQAYRLATRGQTSMKGKPINDPGTPGARKINALEAAGKFLGFQPISSAKSYDAYTAAEKARQVRDDKKNDLVLLALKSRDTGSAEGRKEMLRELKAWNDRMDKENRPSMKITFKSVMQTVAARRAENKPTKKNLQKKAEQQAAW